MWTIDSPLFFLVYLFVINPRAVLRCDGTIITTVQREFKGETNGYEFLVETDSIQISFYYLVGPFQSSNLGLGDGDGEGDEW